MANIFFEDKTPVPSTDYPFLYDLTNTVRDHLLTSQLTAGILSDIFKESYAGDQEPPSLDEFRRCFAEHSPKLKIVFTSRGGFDDVGKMVWGRIYTFSIPDAEQQGNHGEIDTEDRCDATNTVVDEPPFRCPTIYINRRLVYFMFQAPLFGGRVYVDFQKGNLYEILLISFQLPAHHKPTRFVLNTPNIIRETLSSISRDKIQPLQADPNYGPVRGPSEDVVVNEPLAVPRSSPHIKKWNGFVRVLTGGDIVIGTPPELPMPMEQNGAAPSIVRI
ncbi:hypothetical protein JAAARDRAFT_46996 [Jaapia argillacea MUCL 33604]|uniref:Uncharacterized protein n=1 Tax=Jaapia argillacea MUCL 33604 TaxID=933084 RepID=A0A067PV38_9AGAM|nr:hypothetical protein JAAARDRAFT_46996 [Jaapia argillacea MUCL 33604]